MKPMTLALEILTFEAVECCYHNMDILRPSVAEKETVEPAVSFLKDVLK